MQTTISRFAADYGMVFVLLVLCAFFSATTLTSQNPTGKEAGRALADDIVDQFGDQARVLVAATKGPDDVQFAEEITRQLEEENVTVVATITGSPADVRAALDREVQQSGRLDAIACTSTVAKWSLVADLGEKIPELAATKVVMPGPQLWPTFLNRDNLINVAAQSAIYAIIGIGMTMVIITAGIDLSVGSLVALAAVTCALCMRDLFGGFEATFGGMVISCAAAILICAVAGFFSGAMVTAFGVHSFVITLAMMSIARGTAKILTEGKNVYQVPKEFSQFAMGRGLGVPNSVILMIVLYIIAHIVMTRTVLGRYIYAVGGNPEAARLSGVPVKRVLLFVYTLCGALAGLGGVVLASKLGSGSPLYGTMYELYVIAAVVVGGTSLAGGEGKILNTLTGALIISVIRNGMNLMKYEDFTQEVVMGLLILAAVLIDVLRKRGWRLGMVN